MLPTDQDEEIIDCVGEVHEKPLILVEKVSVWFSLLSWEGEGLVLFLLIYSREGVGVLWVSEEEDETS